MLAHRSLYQAIGLPLRELVLYADDTEYTRRITAMGGRLRLVTDALIDELELSWNIKAHTRNIYEAFCSAIRLPCLLHGPQPGLVRHSMCGRPRPGCTA